MKIVLCLTNNEEITFEGKYLRERQSEHWHYYLVEKWSFLNSYNCPCILHIRKDQLRYVITEGEEL